MIYIKKLRPTVCNLCGGKVEYIQNKHIYGKPFGSGYCYYCVKCGAYVGTHRARPKEAFGILSNLKMRQAKTRCHDVFDSMWKNYKERQKLYKWLAKELNIDESECHFGYFDLSMLNKAYNILIQHKKDLKKSKQST